MPQDNLAQLYHLHHSRHMEDLPFWLALAESQSGLVLELGCGTGRILLPLVQAGFKAVGLDLDMDMLGFLQSQWPSASETPPIFQADMGHFHLSAHFPLILLPCNTLSTLSRRTRQCTFDCVAAHLSPDGLFSASLPNPQLLNMLPPQSDSEVEDIFYSPLTGNPIQVSSSWKRSSDAFIISWHYDQLLPDGRIERVTMKVQHALSPVDDYLSGLKQSGLDVISLYGDFDYSPFTPESPNVIIVAKKAGELRSTE